MKTNTKTDEIIIKQIRNRLTAKKKLLAKLRYEIGALQDEKERVWYSDTIDDLCKEFGVSKRTVSRISEEIR